LTEFELQQTNIYLITVSLHILVSTTFLNLNTNLQAR